MHSHRRKAILATDICFLPGLHIHTCAHMCKDMCMAAHRGRGIDMCVGMCKDMFAWHIKRKIVVDSPMLDAEQ